MISLQIPEFKFSFQNFTIVGFVFTMTLAKLPSHLLSILGFVGLLSFVVHRLCFY